MAATARDPTEPMRQRASRYPDVDQGTACTQSSFKVGGKSFFFVGMQGGRHKAMFKLRASLPEAERRAAAAPDDYQVGSTAWVTARFTAEKPMPKGLWAKWLDESYELSRPAAQARAAAKTGGAKRAAGKRATKKTAAKQAARRPRAPTRKK